MNRAFGKANLDWDYYYQILHNFLGPKPISLGPLPNHVVKLNVDTTWASGWASMVVLGWNHDGEVLGLWYNKPKCSATLATQLLAIHKACLVSNNFPGKEIQFESDCKTVVKALLRISVCVLGEHY